MISAPLAYSGRQTHSSGSRSPMQAVSPKTTGTGRSGTGRAWLSRAMWVKTPTPRNLSSWGKPMRMVTLSQPLSWCHRCSPPPGATMSEKLPDARVRSCTICDTSPHNETSRSKKSEPLSEVHPLSWKRADSSGHGRGSSRRSGCRMAQSSVPSIPLIFSLTLALNLGSGSKRSSRVAQRRRLRNAASSSKASASPRASGKRAPRLKYRIP
mmetsp:Transcript_55225/g.171071  ORF Transcript_55225/g.171071 Transcript_55225/m.171071 type:complete len:211 (+) Transcript_55225:128-760(+)